MRGFLAVNLKYMVAGLLAGRIIAEAPVVQLVAFVVLLCVAMMVSDLEPASPSKEDG